MIKFQNAFAVVVAVVLGLGAVLAPAYLVARKLRADVRAADAQERIAAALESLAAPERTAYRTGNGTWKFVDVKPGPEPCDALNLHPERCE